MVNLEERGPYPCAAAGVIAGFELGISKLVFVPGFSLVSWLL